MEDNPLFWDVSTFSRFFMEVVPNGGGDGPYANVGIKIVPKSLFCLYCFKSRRILLSVLRFLQAINQTKPSKDIATDIFPQISLQIVRTFFSELLWSSSVLTLLLCNGEL